MEHVEWLGFSLAPGRQGFVCQAGIPQGIRAVCGQASQGEKTEGGRWGRSPEQKSVTLLYFLGGSFFPTQRRPRRGQLCQGRGDQKAHCTRHLDGKPPGSCPLLPSLARPPARPRGLQRLSPRQGRVPVSPGAPCLLQPCPLAKSPLRPTDDAGHFKQDLEAPGLFL